MKIAIFIAFLAFLNLRLIQCSTFRLWALFCLILSLKLVESDVPYEIEENIAKNTAYLIRDMPYFKAFLKAML